MAWTNRQKQLAVRACRAAGISEDVRTDMILRNFAHAHYDFYITSTSPKLTNQDFSAFMAIVERHAGGKILHFTAGYWTNASADELQRMRHRALRIASELEASGNLAANGVGLAGWISKRVSGGATDRLECLEFPALQALIIGLEAYQRQCRVKLQPCLSESACRSASDDAPFAADPALSEAPDPADFSGSTLEASQ
jgi:hypothetical protein